MIVASQRRALGGRELQLPSMSLLTAKTSTQRFFLRVLQVIIQLRDDTRRAHKKAKQAARLGESSPRSYRDAGRLGVTSRGLLGCGNDPGGRDLGGRVGFRTAGGVTQGLLGCRKTGGCPPEGCCDAREPGTHPRGH